MRALGALPVLLAPMLAWAGMGEDAEYAAGRILLEEKVLNVYLAGSDEGRLTILFGNQVPTGRSRPCSHASTKNPRSRE